MCVSCSPQGSSFPSLCQGLYWLGSETSIRHDGLSRHTLFPGSHAQALYLESPRGQPWVSPGTIQSQVGAKNYQEVLPVGAESRDPDLQEYLKVKSRAGEQGAQHPGSTHSHCANHSPMRSAGWNSRGNSCTQLGLFLPGSITPQIPDSHYVPKPRGTGEAQPPKRQRAHTTGSCQHCRESGERQPAKSTQ